MQWAACNALIYMHCTPVKGLFSFSRFENVICLINSHSLCMLAMR